jgi:hypothetical protein
MEGVTPPARTRLLQASTLVGALLFAGLSFFATLDYAQLLHYDSLMSLGDLYPRWYGTRELLNHHRNPYSQEVSAEIQTAYYGHPLKPGDLRNLQAFAYPLYVSFFLWPATLVSFPAARLVFGSILIAAACGFVLCSLKIMGWRLSHPAMVTVLIVSIGSLPALMALLLQQMTLLVGFLVAAGTFALIRGHPLWAGVLLAGATVKPQIVLIPMMWLVFWGFFHQGTGRRFVACSLGCLGGLILASEILLPGWISEFFKALSAYAGYSALYPSLALKLFGRPAGMVILVFLLCLIAVTAVKYRKVEPFDPRFSLMFALTLAVTLLTMPGVGAYIYNHVLLLPALLLVGRIWAQLSWLTRAGIMVPVLLPLAEVLAARTGYQGPWRVEGLALMLVLPVFVVATILLRWRPLTHWESDGVA